LCHEKTKNKTKKILTESIDLFRIKPNCPAPKLLDFGKK